MTATTTSAATRVGLVGQCRLFQVYLPDRWIFYQLVTAHMRSVMSRSKGVLFVTASHPFFWHIESFNDRGVGGGGCHIFFPVLGGDGTAIVPPGDLFYQPPGEMS